MILLILSKLTFSSKIMQQYLARNSENLFENNTFLQNYLKIV